MSRVYQAEERFKSWKSPEIEEMKLTKYMYLVQYKDGLTLGNKIDIGQFTYINAFKGVVIEDYVQIASHCSIYSASTIDNKSGAVTLKKNCRIGTHSVIMPGVTVGENSIVGAFSFVKDNIPDNVLAFGTPAKVTRPLTENEMGFIE